MNMALLKLKKRGEASDLDLELMAVHLILFLAIFLTLIFAVSKIQDRQIHNERIMVRDIAALRDVLVHAPENSAYQLNYELKKNFKVEIKNKPCTVQISRLEEKSIINYPCAENNLAKINEETKEGGIIYQIKNE